MITFFYFLTNFSNFLSCFCLSFLINKTNNDAIDYNPLFFLDYLSNVDIITVFLMRK